jgi:hypothetical protein
VTWVRQRALGLVVLGLFVLSWAGQAVFQAAEFLDTQREHGQEIGTGIWSAWRSADFWEEFWRATLENWQSEWLQVATFVILTSFLVWKGSAESSDSDERIEAKLDELLGPERARRVEARLPEKYRR